MTEYDEYKYELQDTLNSYKEKEESVSEIRDRLLNIVDNLYCKDWDDLDGVDGDDDED